MSTFRAPSPAPRVRLLARRPVRALALAALVVLAGVLAACAGPQAPTEPVVAVEMMAASQNPTLGSPDSDREATALYGSGCAWVTRDGAAVVCFSGAGGPLIAMTVLGTQERPARRFRLYLRAKGDDTPYRKHPEHSAAERWLAAHRVQRSEGLSTASLRFSPDRGRFSVAAETKLWGAAVPALPAGLAPSDWTAPRRARCCSTAVRALVLPPLGTPVALVQATCKVTPAAHPCQRDAALPCPAPPRDGCGTYAGRAAQRSSEAPLRLVDLRPVQRAADAKPRQKTAAERATERLRGGPRALQELAAKPAPARFTVVFDTTRGRFKVELVRAWAPHGVDRFYRLVAAGFFHDIAFFRVIPGFMAQFGVHGDPAVAAAWAQASVPDDPVNPARASNQRGMLTFAKAGPNTRSTQLFINFRDNTNLDRMGFPPIGRVLGGGMAVVDRLYSGYGEGAPRGRGPDQGTLQSAGNAYLRKAFPLLDYVRSITLAPQSSAPQSSAP